MRQVSHVGLDEKGMQSTAVTIVTVARPPPIDHSVTDLCTAIEVALARGDWPPALLCVRTYLAESKCHISSITEVLKANDRGDYERALELASDYASMSDQRSHWAKLLALCLAWEAARQGHSEAAEGAIKAAGPDDLAIKRKPVSGTGGPDMQTLAVTHGGYSVAGWLKRWAWEEADTLCPFLAVATSGLSAKTSSGVTR